ncbi:MAG: quinone oxidoreductase [Gammaproteobacteria bacterium]|nr:quinone oxidoreductase [Gammaproteobacteria bacterium]MCY4323659.1 quinone oxidoreductase [Gammaproteobacteria bacterium]
MKIHAWQISKPGGPEALEWSEREIEPQANDVLVRHTAIGVNFIDTYFRKGLYPAPLPIGIGAEGAGIVEAVGSGVTEFSVGDRVGYCGGTPGSYSEARFIDEASLVRLPDAINEEVSAACLLKGLTVAYLIFKTFPLNASHTALFHAAAGGVGLIFCQWAKSLGVRIIGTAGSEEKAALAYENGCDEVILYREQDVARRVRELTDGRGVDVAYDAVGKDTFEGTLGSLAPRGLFVSFGNASGPPPAVNALDLMSRGSLFFTRTSLMHYTSTRAELLALSRKLFEAIEHGTVKVHINHRYRLADAPQVHRDLEARRTTGSVIMVP